MTAVITKAHLVAWLERSAALLEEQKAYLTDLDAAIGDADHGLNMARGFAKVLEKLPAAANAPINSLLNTVGMALISSVGGASGPLYGTFFMKAGSVVPNKQELTAEDVLRMLEAGIEGIIQRGRAEAGDKTMLDTLIPAAQAVKHSLENGGDLTAVLDAAASAASDGLQATIPMIARKGRASYLGERSIGHPDPGATSATYLLTMLRDVVKA